VLRGASTHNIKSRKSQKFDKAITAGVLLSVLQACAGEDGGLPRSLTKHAYQSTVPTAMDQLLQQFEEIFQDPTQLPPFRQDYDHIIHVVQGSGLINKRSPVC